MKAVSNESPLIHWARVRNGQITVWNGNETVRFKKISGKINGVYFKSDEYNALPYEVALFHLTFQDERWILSMRVDSQYFRTLCNYLHTLFADGRHTQTLTFTPAMNEKDGKRYAAVYLSIYAPPGEKEMMIRAYFRTEGSILPPPIITELGGRKLYDWTPVNDYYKEWLKTNFPAGYDGGTTQIMEQLPPPPSDDPDDLPF
jgi:hypothetical protein